MKKIKIITLITIIAIHFGCTSSHNPGRISITVSESEEKFNISAKYDPAKQDKVAEVLDQYLRDANGPSFKNTMIDAEMVLPDKRNFYIKFSPGNLDLKASKLKNKRPVINQLRKMVKELGEAIK